MPVSTNHGTTKRVVRSLCLSGFLSGALLAAVSATATVAQAQYGAAILTMNNNCLVPDGNRAIRVFSCTQGGARYNIRDGRVSTSDGFCFDHGVAKGMDPSRSDARVILTRCSGGASQQWYFIGSGKGKGLAQNAANPAVCLNIKGGTDSNGGEVIVWNCGYNAPARNETFVVGEQVTGTGALTVLSQVVAASTLASVRNGGSATFGNGSRLVASGAGNLIASGAGNLVSQGGGNLVSAGAGNLITQDGGTLRAIFGGASMVGR